MIKLQDILKQIIEGKQVGTLYHNTNLGQALEIIKSNRLNITSNDLNTLTNFRTFRDDNVIISPFGPIIKDRTKIKPFISFTRDKDYVRFNNNVRFVLDGDKLSQNYKIIPYSQFGGRENDEREERIQTDISNLSKYIIKIILSKSTPEIESALKEKNIPYEIK